MPGYTGYYPSPYTGTPKAVVPGYTTPTSTQPNNTYTLPPPSSTYQLPPPPPIPALPPPPTNNFLTQLQSLIGQFKTAQPFAQLGPEIMALLGQGKAAAMAGFEDAKSTALDQQLASLFGRGVERSSIAADSATRLSTQLGAARAQIEADAAAKELAARQYAGQFGAANLAQLASVLGTGAGLEQSAYRDSINALLQHAGLGMQGYGIQTGNTMQQQQLSQQYALAQQQMQQQLQMQQQDFLNSLFQQMLGGGFGGSLGGGLAGSSYTGGAGSAGLPGYGYGTPQQQSNTTSPEMIQQELMNYLLQYLRGLG